MLAAEPMVPFYTSSIEETFASLGDAFEATDRFANVAFSETMDDTVYFDSRDGIVASPLQAYLELATGDKRSKETAWAGPTRRPRTARAHAGRRGVMGPLFSSLLDLLRELDSSGIPITIGGGYGLYLKRRHLERTGEHTILEQLPGGPSHKRYRHVPAPSCSPTSPARER